VHAARVCFLYVPTAFTDNTVYRVATHLENLENLEKSGNLRVVREKRKVGVFLHMVNYRKYWSWHKMCSIGLLYRLVLHLYKQRLSHWSILKNIVVIKMSWNNMHRYCCEGPWAVSNHLCTEKSGNLIIAGWPPRVYSTGVGTYLRGTAPAVPLLKVGRLEYAWAAPLFGNKS